MSPGVVGTYPQSFHGLLVNAIVEPITQDLSVSYTVPNGKNLYISQLFTTTSYTFIDGIAIKWGYSNSTTNDQKLSNQLILKSGQVLTVSSGVVGTYPQSFNGYLVDENYFANCGGGGSSSATSSLDSTTIANMIAAALPAPAAQIGEFRDGGVVFWVDASGQHGLVCDIQDLGMVEWGCEGTLISGADGTNIVDGIQNTIDILANCSTVGIAADLCANSTAQGYNDWFLPSKDALNELWLKRNDLYFTLLTNGGSGFNDYYWSSSEYDANDAWKQHFLSGVQFNSQKSNISITHVRAIRVF